MKMQLITSVALVLVSTSLAEAAAVTPQQLAAQYQAEGYTRIEVDYSQTRAEVEAIKDGVKREVLYDLATGQILKQETERVVGDDDTTPGIFLRPENEDDDLNGGRESDDDRYDDHDDDNGGGDDHYDDHSDHDDDGQEDDHGGHGRDHD